MPRVYVKKGATYREFLRCPLCGKLSRIGYFSQNHLFGVYRSWFCGRGNIRWELSKKDNVFMVALTQSMVTRLLHLLYVFTGVRYAPERFVYTQISPSVVPAIVSIVKPMIQTRIVPPKVVIE